MLRRPVGTVDRPIVAGARGTMRRRCVDWDRDRAVDPERAVGRRPVGVPRRDPRRAAGPAAPRRPGRSRELPQRRDRVPQGRPAPAPWPCRRRPPRSRPSSASRRSTGSRSCPRGAGTGLSGGAAGIEGGLTIALTRMDRILEIDRENLVVVTQPGIINAELKKRVAAEGLFYAPDPASYEICSIGGNLGTNAGGLCCVKYGQTRDSVLGPRGRPRRRPRHPDRRQERQGHRRLRADPPLRRVAGDARDHHRGDAPAAGRAAAAVDDARLLPVARRRRRRGRRGSSRPGRTR